MEQILPQFRGEILQLPPMYSAVQKDGQRLYVLARQGIEVEREKRPVTIFKCELVSFDENTQTGTLCVACSKGTYTPQDRNADLLIQKPIGQIFSQIKVKGK